MKIVITSTGIGASAGVDRAFGRAKYFIVADTESEEMEAVSNEQVRNIAQGAGIQAATIVSDLGAGAVVTGNVGPKAFRVLSSAGIDVFIAEGPSVGEALAAFKAGKLSKVEGATVEGEWV